MAAVRIRWVAVLIAVLIGIPFLGRLWLLRVRAFDPDELQHLHAAWCIAQGQLPYRDYFDHHTPFLHLLLAPLLLWLRPERAMADAVSSLFLARAWMWGMSAGILASTFALGRRWAGTLAAAFGTLLLSNSVVFLAKSLEIRPDVPALLLFLAGLLLVQRGRHPRGLLLAGLSFGAAAMFTPKVVFGLPGVYVVVCFGVAYRQALLDLAALSLGVVLPALATLSYWTARGALAQFLNANVTVPLGWRRGSGPEELIAELLRQDPIHALGIVALAASLLGLTRGRREDALLTLPLLGFLAGLFSIPEIARQYFILFLPLLALLAGRALVRVAGWTAGGPSSLPRSLLVAVAVLGLTAHSLSQQLASFAQSNQVFLDRLRFVLQNSGPHEAVLDGFSGLGVFRPHAHYYYYLLGKIRSTWPARERERLLRSLRSGEVAPRFVVWDEYVQTTAPAVTEFLSRHYVDLGRPPLRARLFDNGLGRWVDTGPRALGGPAALGVPYALLGSGWEPARGGGEDGVRSTAPSAELLLPVAAPRAFRATLRARAVAGEMALTLHVNGRDVGSVLLGPEWADHRFAIPNGVLRRGLNAFLLRWAPTRDRDGGAWVISLAIEDSQESAAGAPLSVRPQGTGRGRSLDGRYVQAR